jgi:hypothetical protein
VFKVPKLLLSEKEEVFFPLVLGPPGIGKYNQEIGLEAAIF